MAVVNVNALDWLLRGAGSCDGGHHGKTNEQQTYSWAVYHLAARQKFVGLVHDQPDADSAIKAAIEE